MGKIYSYIGSINEMDFQKDVILTPYYLAKWLDTTCELYYGQSRSHGQMPEQFRNVHLNCLNEKPESICFFLKLLYVITRKAKQIEVLMTFHLSTRIILLTIWLKLLNKKAKVWILADLNLDVAEKLAGNEFVFSTGPLGSVKKKIINHFFRVLDIFSLETTRYVELFEPIFDKNEWKCLTYFPCSWDEDNDASMDNPGPKENIILSCARFGTYQKNTEMLLEGIAKTDLQDWIVYLVGPVTDDFSLGVNTTFKKYIEEYYSKYPSLKNKVIFTGPIFDTKVLFSYFERAKVFVMTSRYEGFANVFAQARWNQCYIVSTDVGGAQDMSNNWEYGISINQEDADSLSSALNNIIAGNFQTPPRAFAGGISYNKTITTFICPKLLEHESRI